MNAHMHARKIPPTPSKRICCCTACQAALLPAAHVCHSQVRFITTDEHGHAWVASGGRWHTHAQELAVLATACVAHPLIASLCLHACLQGRLPSAFRCKHRSPLPPPFVCGHAHVCGMPATQSICLHALLLSAGGGQVLSYQLATAAIDGGGICYELTKRGELNTVAEGHSAPDYDSQGECAAHLPPCQPGAQHLTMAAKLNALPACPPAPLLASLPAYPPARPHICPPARLCSLLFGTLHSCHLLPA